MKHLIKEFKEFISKGNVIDLAVGVIIGGAFTAIVNSLVTDIFMPILGLITGGLNFSALSLQLHESNLDLTLNYGLFISAVISFLLISVVVFLLIKIINKIRTTISNPKEDNDPELPRKCPFCQSEIDILATRCPHCTSQLPKDERVAEAEKNAESENNE